MMPQIAQRGRCKHRPDRSGVQNARGAIGAEMHDGSPDFVDRADRRSCRADNMRGQGLVGAGDFFEFPQIPIARKDHAERALGSKGKDGEALDRSIKILRRCDVQAF